MDYHFEDSRAGESHPRVYENGTVEHIATIYPYRISSNDPIKEAKLQRTYIAENNRIYNVLKKKGFTSY